MCWVFAGVYGAIMLFGESNATLSRSVRILGTRGVPAAHGGFETFAECLSLYLVQRGWRVVVYCQEGGSGPFVQDAWRGVERVRIPVRIAGPAGSVIFDWLAAVHAARARDLCLTLGYNTALFCALLRLRGVANVINMDGIEWSRAKWSKLAKLWFWVNDWAGCWMGNHLVADHPEILRHLATRVPGNKITMIPYGADDLVDVPVEPLCALGLEPMRYLTLVARPEPENSILEVVQGFSRRHRGVVLAVLGHYEDGNAYHQAVRGAAGAEVRFLGAMYDKATVQALRAHCIAYVHGHQVGGTNPSLVEALGAGNAVVAHDNRFNRWVAGDGAAYFSDATSLDQVLTALLTDETSLRQSRESSKARYRSTFTWSAVLTAYEQLLASQPRSDSTS